ncbi:MAG TPA: FAD-binding oxidoreductase [Steroidobacteraceae bacterium]|nr:FAD-binding oxidoreductase [Steroidobacteraceae bacterium]
MPDVLEPHDEREAAAILCDANQAGRVVTPRGGGTKIGWGNPPSETGVILSTTRLNQVIEHAWGDLTVTVEAGCTVAELQRTLALHGQRLAVDVLWPERATVGGILSTNDSGALRLRYGGLRDLIIGCTLALADGTLAKSGGKVVKNVAGYDLSKLATGALGTLGVITRAVFRLHPLPQNARTLTILARDAGGAQKTIDAIQNSQLAHAALQVRVESKAAPQVDILLEGTEAGIAAQELQIRKLAAAAAVVEGSPGVWSAREQLWEQPGTIAKFSVLPADIAKTVASIGSGSWSAVVQATGIGWLRRAAGGMKALRATIEGNGGKRSGGERSGGSLVILRDAGELDAWGTAGDTLPLMRALKQQFDPRGTLNPGRFLGGI